MNIFKWIKKRNLKRETHEIINVSDIVDIPSRDYYKNDSAMIKLIDEYKRDYKARLSKFKVITTLDLGSPALLNDMIMVQDLLLHHIFGDNDTLKLSTEELLIQKCKVKLYYGELDSLYRYTIARLIALNELHDQKVIPRWNRMCLAEEINKLSTSLVLYLTNQASIVHKLKAYIASMDINCGDIDTSLLINRYNKLLFISNDIIDVNDIESLPNIEDKIAYMETVLEKYVYCNKGKVQELRNELDNIFNVSSNKEELLRKVISLEKLFILFYEYGNKLVNEDDLKRLYEIKFNLLVSDIYYLSCSPIKKEDYGFEYYKNIIFKKLETIILGKNKNFNDMDITGESFEKFKNSFKDSVTNEFDLEKILLDMYRLQLLVCFDKENGFEDLLFSHPTLRTSSDVKNKTYFEQFLNIPGISLEEKIPFVSALQLICEEDCYHPLYLVFNAYAKKYSPRAYILPEGVKSIDGKLLPPKIKDKIKAESRGRRIVFPSTLKSIKGSIFEYSIDDTICASDERFWSKYYNNVRLNEGLEEIGENVFLGLEDFSITIPSSVRMIGLLSFEGTDLKSITLDDYKKSNVLNNRENLKMLFKIFLKWKQYGEMRILTIDPKAGYAERHTTTNSCEVAREYAFMPHTSVGRNKKIISKLEYITLKDGDEEIRIDLKELSSVEEAFPYPYFLEKVADCDISPILRTFRNLVLRESGYDIFESELYNLSKQTSMKL